MTQPCIANIINFIRAVEPRLEMDLVEPVQRQIALLGRHKLPGTWLLQYDALVQGPYVNLLKSLGPEHEIGGWFEVVQPLVEKAGLPWRGRHPWDWHASVGFAIGYTPAEREKLADVFMADFKDVFGRYPASVGSWVLDAHLLAYLHKRYGLAGACNCKDQWGTDGYTLWGGYWAGAYYPSRLNAFMPAQTVEGQVPVPVFRMLGSDPIYQYDAGLGDSDDIAAGKAHSVVTLESVCKEGGGNSAWVRWFFDLMGKSPSLSFSYAQVGQENSFGWAKMERGLTDQVELLAQKAAGGRWRVETLETSARWFKQAYSVTPESAVAALKDWQNQSRRSLWYQSRFYRVNLFWEDGTLRIRDLHKFDEHYRERYLADRCITTGCRYDTLPLVEGLLWSRGGFQAGLVPMARAGGKPMALLGGDPSAAESGTGGLRVRWPVNFSGDLIISCQEGVLEFACDLPDWWLELTWSPAPGSPGSPGSLGSPGDGAPGVLLPFRAADGDQLICQHEGFDYAVLCSPGQVVMDGVLGRLQFRPEGGRIGIRLDQMT